VAQNVLRGRRAKNGNGRAERRVEVGRELRITGHLVGLARPLLMTVIFTGLRASELRGLRWVDIDFEHHELHVRQRADIFNAIGPPKSKAGARTIPLPPIAANTLREWKLKAGTSELVFSRDNGRPWNYNIVQNVWHVVQIAAGVVDAEGGPKYPGLHALRHFYASSCINRKADGGLELPIKVVQARMGHASIQMTADTYGHLFPRTDDGSELAAAERALVAVP